MIAAMVDTWRGRGQLPADIDVEAVGQTLGALIPGSYVLELFLGPTRIADGVKALIDKRRAAPRSPARRPGPIPCDHGANLTTSTRRHPQTGFLKLWARGASGLRTGASSARNRHVSGTFPSKTSRRSTAAKR